jgi:hypothetical protein
MGIATTLSGLGEIAIRQRQFDSAITLLDESLHLRREIGHKWGIAVTLGSLAWLSILQDNLDRAVHVLNESLLIRKEINDRVGMAWCMEKLAEIAILRGDNGRAVRIFGGATTLRNSIASVVDPVDHASHQALLSKLRARLTDEIYEAVWAEGQSLSLEQLLEYSLRPIVTRG